LTALIEAKREGKTFIEEEAPKRAPVIDMMEALKTKLARIGSAEAKEADARASWARARRPAATGELKRKSREFFLIHLS
jgi:non-homologous end joining protein Ku